MAQKNILNYFTKSKNPPPSEICIQSESASESVGSTVTVTDCVNNVTEDVNNVTEDISESINAPNDEVTNEIDSRDEDIDDDSGDDDEKDHDGPSSSKRRKMDFEEKTDKFKHSFQQRWLQHKWLRYDAKTDNVLPVVHRSGERELYDSWN